MDVEHALGAEWSECLLISLWVQKLQEGGEV